MIFKVYITHHNARVSTLAHYNDEQRAHREGRKATDDLKARGYHVVPEQKERR